MRRFGLTSLGHDYCTVMQWTYAEITRGSAFHSRRAGSAAVLDGYPVFAFA